MTQVLCNSFAWRVSLRILLAICGCLAALQALGQSTTPPGSAGPTTTPPPPAPSAATSCPAAFGVYNPIASPSPSSASGSSTPSSTPPVSVQQINGGSAPSPGGGAAPAGGGAPNSGGTNPKTQLLRSGIINLQNNKVSSFDVATALSGKISGVTLVPVGPLSLFYTIDATKIGSQTSAGQTDTDGVLSDLEDIINKLPPVSETLEIIKLPDGFGHACDIVTAIGHQIPNVVSMSVIDDSRILAGIADIAGEPNSVAQTADSLRKLANRLAVSSAPPSPKVTSVLTQLFYNRDAQSVATAITQSFSQLKVSPVISSASSSYADSLILADPTGSAGDNSSGPLNQARRMIALIDQPRPQITVNAWSLQVSSENQKKMRQLVPEARRFAAGYNDALERSILRAWTYLNKQVANGDGSYLDRTFAEYLCAIAEYPGVEGNNGAFQPISMGKCPSDPNAHLAYSLGYTDIFDRESPNLVQLMLLMMATNNPGQEAQNTLNEMEDVNAHDCPRKGEVSEAADSGESSYCAQPFPRLDSCQEADTYLYDLQVKIRDKNYKPNLDVVASDDGSKDKSDSDATFDKLHTRQPPLYGAFECTRDRLSILLSPPSDPSDPPIPSYVGLFRAAVADFLFQNKMKAEYPNDFAPYLYPASAAKLDSALTPIIEAFNEDMQAMQQYLQNQLTNGIPKDKSLAYTSNGLITVSVLSGSQASVQTQSLNYFPQNPTMTLENFAAQLAAAAGGNSQTGLAAQAPVPMLAGTLSSVVNAVAAYKAAEPAQVTAKVGSGLSMTVTPYALSSDSGAELNVNVTYNENGAATLSANSTQAQTGDDLNSRVSEHEVSTLVRMDALKFFEISTMQSVIAREKAPYKLIDPIIELPLLDGLGVFPNWRRKPDAIYNQSVIFLQASILPTAADLGNGIRMQYDRLFEPCSGATPCHSAYKEARAESDFGGDSIRCNCDDDDKLQGSPESQADHRSELARIMEYHRMMIRYFSGAPENGLCSASPATSTGEKLNCLPSWKDIDPIADDAVPEFEYKVSSSISSKR
jgi:hypothetical protein